MIDGTYYVEMDSPLGKKNGLANLVTHGDVLEVSVDAPIIGKKEATGTLKGNAFTASGMVKVPLKGEVNYQVDGQVVDGILTAQFKTGKGDFNIIGARLE